MDGSRTSGTRTIPLAFGSFGAVGSGTAGATNLQLTQPLLWAMIAISTAGAIVTFAFLVYALWRYRDPAVRRRRYG
ncbi:MAG: hypothetical protein ACLQD8_08020 [Thermoplasmata archaeon]